MMQRVCLLLTVLAAGCGSSGRSQLAVQSIDVTTTGDQNMRVERLALSYESSGRLSGFDTFQDGERQYTVKISYEGDEISLVDFVTSGPMNTRRYVHNDGLLSRVENAGGETLRSYVYDSANRLLSAKNGEYYEETYEYDGAGKVVKRETRGLAGVNTQEVDSTTTFEYDGDLVQKISMGMGREWSYSYDGDDRLSEIKSEVFGTTKILYDQDDRIQEVLLEDSGLTRKLYVVYAADIEVEGASFSPGVSFGWLFDFEGHIHPYPDALAIELDDTPGLP